MPYIKQKDRDKFVTWIQDKNGNEIKIRPEDPIYVCNTSGELNYFITILLHAYINKKGESYTIYNDVIGVLECAKQELYRRKIAPYEDKAIKRNGDV